LGPITAESGCYQHQNGKNKAVSEYRGGFFVVSAGEKALVELIGNVYFRLSIQSAILLQNQVVPCCIGSGGGLASALMQGSLYADL